MSVLTVRVRVRPVYRTSWPDMTERRRTFRDNPDDICGIFSSGGTTGRPKGILWTNQVFETMVAAMLAHMPPKNRPCTFVPRR